MSRLITSSSATSSPLPDYYSILNVPQHAAFDDILKSYQRLALQLHPELHPDDEIIKTAYQELNQAYFILSDQERRRQYDHRKKQISSSNSSALTSVFFPAAAEHVDFFDNVFAELIEEEIKQGQSYRQKESSSVWRALGATSGSVLGFIFANIPGAMIGAVAGYKAGHVRDQTGKSVMDVWRSMNADKRRSILNKLVQKLLF